MRTIQLSRDILSREIIIDQNLAKIFALFSFIILTSLGAYVRIPLPFTPVPITLQTFFVLLSGAALGKKWGAASQTGYLILGTLGLPVFAGANAGVSYLFGPTGGYIFGFVVTSWFVGKMVHPAPMHTPGVDIGLVHKGGVHQQVYTNTSRLILIMIIGSLAGIYLFGLLGLKLFLKCTFFQALSLGFFPFIIGDAIKIICAGIIFRKIEKRCREIF